MLKPANRFGVADSGDRFGNGLLQRLASPGRFAAQDRLQLGPTLLVTVHRVIWRKCRNWVIYPHGTGTDGSTRAGDF